MLAGPPAFRLMSKWVGRFFCAQKEGLMAFTHKLSVRPALLNGRLARRSARMH